MTDQQNPEFIHFNDKDIKTEELLERFQQLQDECETLKTNNRKAIQRFRRESALTPLQAELIHMQQYLEESQTRMIILFEGREGRCRKRRHHPTRDPLHERKTLSDSRPQQTHSDPEVTVVFSKICNRISTWR